MESVFLAPAWGIDALDSASIHSSYYSKASHSFVKTYAHTGSVTTGCLHNGDFTNLVVGVRSVKHVRCSAVAEDGKRTCVASKHGSAEKLCYPTIGDCHLNTENYPCNAPGHLIERDFGNGHDQVCCFNTADVPAQHQWMWLGRPNAAAAKADLAALVLGIV